VAANLKHQELSFAQIAELTGLSIEDIEKLT
jgi:hypothetical protein